MSFTPRIKPITSFIDKFEPMDNPTWDEFPFTWEETEYWWDYFGYTFTYTDRIKPNTIFTNI